MRKKIRKICLVVIILALGVIYFNSFEDKKGIKVTKFDNLYNEESIKIFYEHIRDKTKIHEKITKLEETYSVKEISNKEDNELDKILKTTDILKNIGDYDDIEETKYLNGYDILTNKSANKRKISKRDSAIIQRDLILALGYESRIGIFKKEKPQFEKNPEYYVVEYWSPEFNKWILIDFEKRGYLKKGDKPLGAIELLEEKGKDYHFYGNYKSKDYKRDIKEYLSSYTIPIDNTVERKESNCFITYIKSNKDIDLLSKGEYLPPTIFTENGFLYEKSPWNEYKKDDKNTYIILMKKALDEDEKDLTKEELDIEKNKFILGAFKNGKVIKKYKLKLDDGEFKDINDSYTEIILKKGLNKIQISENGKDINSTIEINREK